MYEKGVLKNMYLFTFIKKKRKDKQEINDTDYLHMVWDWGWRVRWDIEGIREEITLFLNTTFCLVLPT